MKRFKPVTPGRRQMTVVEYKGTITTSTPFKALTMNVSKSSGRNNHGRITMRHQGGGNKRVYRMVDFRQNKIGIPGKIETVEYDPYRSAFISLVVYKDGERRYILAPKDIKVGNNIITSESADLVIGNRMCLKNIPIGHLVYNVELLPGVGGRLARSAGSYAEVLGHEGGYSNLKLSSGEVRKVKSDCFASIGQTSNPDYNLINIGKAGRSRWLGIRPTVRGTVMNPCDHPYGGGEGRQPRGTRRPKDIWGNITGGRKTRKKKKWSNKLIIQRRPKTKK